MLDNNSNVGMRTLRELIERQGYRCALSGRPLTPEASSVDHRVPVSRGGGHGPENIWIVHADVNRAKGTLTVEEFVSLCGDVVAHQAAKEQPTTNEVNHES